MNGNKVGILVAGDGFHGTEDLADGAVGDSSSSGSSVQTKTINYTFETNLEGMLMFQSQYNEEHKMNNFVNMVGGGALTVFKILLYFVFTFRTLILAIISIIAPVLILINSYKEIKNEKGFLLKWFKFYLYLIFLRPAIGYLYYILAGKNKYLVSEFPLFILLVFVIIAILLIMSMRLMIRNIRGNKKRNAARKKKK